MPKLKLNAIEQFDARNWLKRIRATMQVIATEDDIVDWVSERVIFLQNSFLTPS